jgi:nucleoside-diphosphate-sugar epimerase
LEAGSRARVAVAGAAGSIGRSVSEALAKDFEVVALVGSRARVQAPEPGLPFTWRYCEPFSRREVDAAVAGCDYAIYLVHTRLPTARLDQAECADMDLLIADNFAKAAKRNGVKQIVYLGGLVPEGNVSRSILDRRNEVVEALAQHGVPVTSLRAGLVVSPGSNAVRLVAGIATRLPWVLIPRWAVGLKQPIALTDVVRAIRYCVGNQETYGEHYDIGGPTKLTFPEVIQRTGSILKKAPRVFTVPLVPVRLYEWYLRLLAPKSHPALIRLVVENLPHDLVAQDNTVQRFVSKGAVLARNDLNPYLERAGGTLPANPREPFMEKHVAGLQSMSNVRSIQRFDLPEGRNATWVADTYFSLMPRFAWPFVQCRRDPDGSWSVFTRFPRLQLLTLEFKPSHSSPDRRMYFITGGLLSRGHGDLKPRFEFRDVLEGRYTIAAIHDYTPRLPWGLYSATQAIIHLLFARVFQKRLAKLANPKTFKNKRTDGS